jgi:predicted benzoate:H+ symporter BenE
MVDFRFSLIAALACLMVALLAGVKGVGVVAAVWGLLAVGFLVRALQGRRRGPR